MCTDGVEYGFGLKEEGEGGKEVRKECEDGVDKL